MKTKIGTLYGIGVGPGDPGNGTDTGDPGCLSSVLPQTAVQWLRARF